MMKAMLGTVCVARTACRGIGIVRTHDAHSALTRAHTRAATSHRRRSAGPQTCAHACGSILSSTSWRAFSTDVAAGTPSQARNEDAKREGSRTDAHTHTHTRATRIAAVRGMHDVFPSESGVRRAILDKFHGTCGRYGFQEVETPVIEHTSVFARSLGRMSDIVSKEMYTFRPPRTEAEGGETDRDSLTLRPEGTAGVIRAVVSARDGLRHLPLRYCYHGPMFRHERPQRGRLRQFTQCGVEYIGGADPMIDVEVIACAHAFLRGVVNPEAFEIKLLLNSLGDEACMQSYSAALTTYFQRHAAQLSADSRARLERGAVLRILDSKAPADGDIIRRAPAMREYLSGPAAARFDAVKSALGTLGIEFQQVDTLVRGLDYYRHTIFEFLALPRASSTDKVAGQAGTILAGGRYDTSALGGPANLSAIGWAAGLERLQLATALAAPLRPHTVAVLPCASGADGSRAEVVALTVAHALRERSFCVITGWQSRNLRSQLQAVQAAADTAVIVGEDEVRGNFVSVKNLHTRQQERVDIGADLEQVSAVAAAVRANITD